MNKKLIAVIATTPFIGSECLYAQQNNRPNIIVFIVDDMGWQDTSVPFWNQKTKYNEMYETPNMERLAKQGVMFTQLMLVLLVIQLVVA